MKLLTEWKDYKNQERKALKALNDFKKFLIVEHGGGLFEGMAYTSSGLYAALWNCNTQARIKALNKNDFYFLGIAATENNDPVFIIEEIEKESREEKQTHFIIYNKQLKEIIKNNDILNIGGIK